MCLCWWPTQPGPTLTLMLTLPLTLTLTVTPTLTLTLTVTPTLTLTLTGSQTLTPVFFCWSAGAEDVVTAFSRSETEDRRQ